MADSDEFNTLKARDVRIRALDIALTIDQELRECKTLALLVDYLEDDAREAMHVFADVNPQDFKAVGEIQARIHNLVYFRRFIAFIRSSGDAAATALQTEDVTHIDE
jgi:hypothetical protein